MDLPAINNLETELTVAVDVSDLEINVVSTSGWPATDGIFSLGQEICFYTAKTGTKFTGLTRGYDGTVAVSHSLIDLLTGDARKVQLRIIAKHITDLQTASGSTPSQLNKNMVALLTSSDEDQAVTAGIGATPAKDGYVTVLINGVIAVVGDGVKTTDCYFSGNSGTDARLIDDIVSGDTLHWNGSVALYELATDDRIDFLFDN